MDSTSSSSRIDILNGRKVRCRSRGGRERIARTPHASNFGGSRSQSEPVTSSATLLSPHFLLFLFLHTQLQVIDHSYN